VALVAGGRGGTQLAERLMRHESSTAGRQIWPVF